MSRRQIPWSILNHWTWPIALLLLASCEDGIQVSDTTGPSTVSGLGRILCPVDWSGTSLDDALMRSLDSAFASAFEDIAVGIDQEIKKRDIKIVRKIVLTKIVFRMPDPPSSPDNQNTLGFLYSVRLYVKPNKAGSELTKQLLGEKSGIADRATSVSLETKSVNLKPYFDEGFDIEIEVQPKTCLRDDVTFVVDYTASLYL